MSIISPLFFAILLLLFLAHQYNLLKIPRSLFFTIINVLFYWAVAPDFLVHLLILIGISYFLLIFLKSVHQNLLRYGLFSLGVLFIILNIVLFKEGNQFVKNMIGVSQNIGSQFVPLMSYQYIYPLGLSYYGLQIVGIFFDVLWRRVQFNYSIIEFIASVSFFPSIASGPILRTQRIVEQLRSQYAPISSQVFVFATLLIANGVFKKCLGDLIDIHLTDFRFNLVYSNFLKSLVAIFGIHTQLYLDFSGYSDVAVGIAALFGIAIPQNFRLPFYALSVADYWRRWHITLGEWVRDYFFFPFSTKMPLRERIRLGKIAFEPTIYLGIIISFVLIGLWHGLNKNYLVWGLYSGALVILSPALVRLCQWSKVPAASIILTYILGAFGNVFFLFPEFSYNLRTLMALGNPVLGGIESSLTWLFLMIFVGYAGHLIDAKIYSYESKSISGLKYMSWLMFLLTFVGIFAMTGRVFIYEQF